MSVNEKMTAIADTIRWLLGIEDKLTLDDMQEKIIEVNANSWQIGLNEGYSEGYQIGYTEGETDGYSTGHSDGHTSGYEQGAEDGIATGKQAECDRFWKAFTRNGTRKAYDFAFYRWGTADGFYPTYDIAPTNMMSFMQYFNQSGADNEPLDLSARLEMCGVRLDTSNATNMNRAFYWTSGLCRLPTLDLSSCTDASYMFGNCAMLETIDKIILADNNTQPLLADTFTSATKLKNITFEGTIGRDINLQWCPLTPQSAWGVVQHLAPFIPGDTGYCSYTVTFSADVWEALNEYAIGNELPDWWGNVQNYIEADLGWKTA